MCHFGQSKCYLQNVLEISEHHVFYKIETIQDYYLNTTYSRKQTEKDSSRLNKVKDQDFY